ncbi:lipid-A-disaccharide synthase [bacterium (candidate division B38) B3_B38]|nr:MAG: lipid-A-disaccharide synthase [bacterium (candidate division B38) B3_B38]
MGKWGGILKGSILIISGEASGELHGAELVRAIRKLSPDTQFFGVGGEQMRQAGVELLYDVIHLEVVGVWEALLSLGYHRKLLKELISFAETHRLSAIVLIDYPYFNLHFAHRVKHLSTPIIYYIAPQVWAWYPGRIKKIARLVDKMLVILPFEEELYRQQGLKVEFVGHPLLEEVVAELDRSSFCKKYNLDEESEIVSLLPGSRQREIKYLLPPMLQSIPLLQRARKINFIISLAERVDRRLVERMAKPYLPQVTLVERDTYNVIKNSDLMVVTSGTATLEAAVLGTPMVVVYKLTFPGYLLAKLLVRVKYISLVNILAGREVVTELLQYRVTARNIAKEVLRLLLNPTVKEGVKKELLGVRAKLGTPGASHRAARAVLQFI